MKLLSRISLKMKIATLKAFYLIITALAVLAYLYFTDDKMIKQDFPYHRYSLNKQLPDSWKDVPELELALRMNGNPAFVKLYSTWFLKSLKLFWPKDRLNLTLVLDSENNEDHIAGDRLSAEWPFPNIVYLQPGNSSTYKENQRRRMYLSYFYPEEYVSAEYVGFVDADTMFTTAVTPQMLFTNGRPTIQARIGEPFWPQLLECWADVTEYFLGEKEALQCMSYFPVVIKVEHIIELRKFTEKRFGKAFQEVFRSSLKFKNVKLGKAYPLLDDCICQFSIICNYLWYHHREEYDFHLEMVPNGNWKGEHRRESQQTTEYILAIDPKYKIPKPRVSIHARHYKENGIYLAGGLDLSKEPYATHMKRRLHEGFCFSFGFQLCPHKCNDFNQHTVQVSLYSFEIYDWIWDSRCLREQEKHLKEVRGMVEYYKRYGKQMIEASEFSKLCNVTFSL